MESKVIVYSTPLCSPCDGLKRYLQANGVSFVSKDLMMDEEAAEHVESLGIRSSPVLEVDGKAYAGADLEPDSLARILGLGSPGSPGSPPASSNR